MSCVQKPSLARDAIHGPQSWRLADYLSSDLTCPVIPVGSSLVPNGSSWPTWRPLALDAFGPAPGLLLQSPKAWFATRMKTGCTEARLLCEAAAFHAASNDEPVLAYFSAFSRCGGLITENLKMTDRMGNFPVSWVWSSRICWQMSLG